MSETEKGKKGKEKLIKADSEIDDLPEQQQRMASAWLDQELPEDERDVIESQLIEGDEALRKEIESYRIVRNEFRGWFESEYGASSRSVNVWNAIEQRLVAEAEAKAARANSFGEWMSRVGEALRALMVRPAFVGGVAAFAAALLFLATDRQSAAPAIRQDAKSQNSGIPQLAERDALMIEALQGGSPESGQSQLASVEQPVNPDLLTTVGFDDLRRSLPSKLPVPDSLAVKLLSSPQLIVQDNIPGGLRTGGADIEWIKTEKPFKLVSSRRAQTPPVIWVRAR